MMQIEHTETDNNYSIFRILIENTEADNNCFIFRIHFVNTILVIFSSVSLGLHGPTINVSFSSVTVPLCHLEWKM